MFVLKKSEVLKSLSGVWMPLRYEKLMVCTNPWVVWQVVTPLLFCCFLYDLSQQRKSTISLSLVTDFVSILAIYLGISYSLTRLSCLWCSNSWVYCFYCLSYWSYIVDNIAKFAKFLSVLYDHTTSVSVRTGQPFVSLLNFVDYLSCLCFSLFVCQDPIMKFIFLVNAKNKKYEIWRFSLYFYLLLLASYYSIVSQFSRS